MTLKDLTYKILLNNSKTRDSRALLKWEVLKEKEFVKTLALGNELLMMSKEDFIKWETDTVRRCSQNLQRSDLLTGTKLIQPTPKVKEKRVKLSKEKGASYMMGKFKFDEVTNTYKEL